MLWTGLRPEDTTAQKSLDKLIMKIYCAKRVTKWLHSYLQKRCKLKQHVYIAFGN